VEGAFGTPVIAWAAFAAGDKSLKRAIRGTLLMTGIAIVGLLYRPEHRILRMVSGISLSLVAVYLVYALILSFYPMK
jgi:hypothetical protein